MTGLGKTIKNIATAIVGKTLVKAVITKINSVAKVINKVASAVLSGIKNTIQAAILSHPNSLNSNVPDNVDKVQLALDLLNSLKETPDKDDIQRACDAVFALRLTDLERDRLNRPLKDKKNNAGQSTITSSERIPKDVKDKLTRLGFDLPSDYSYHGSTTTTDGYYTTVALQTSTHVPARYLGAVKLDDAYEEVTAYEYVYRNYTNLYSYVKIKYPEAFDAIGAITPSTPLWETVINTIGVADPILSSFMSTDPFEQISVKEWVSIKKKRR